MAAFDSINDVKIGTIFSDSFNGMSDFYEVIDKTNKSITLRKIKWETCAPDSDADFDPTYRTAHICLDKNGNPILKIKLNNHCAIGLNKKLIDNFIKAHYDIPIKSINKTEPFEYIQNFGKYQRYKSRHAQFSINLGCFHQFNIDTFPK